MKTFLHNIYMLLFLTTLGTAFALVGFSSSLVFASPDESGYDTYSKSEKNQSFLLAQHRGSPDCRTPRHNWGEHCSEMGHEGGCQRGMGDCRGGKGKRHRGGMGRGMHHGGGQSGSAQCPQPRTTVKAPKEIYNLTNPLENALENIEKGRLLFTLDAQPTCVMCHGSLGDGTGGFGSNLNPRPRNFTCSETMKNISDGQLFWIIRNGSPDTGMPPFQDFQDEQIWNLIRFIRSLSR